MDEIPIPSSYTNLKKISIIANAIAGFLAAVAIIAVCILFVAFERGQEKIACIRRIDLFVQDLRDDVQLTGWATLVARAQGDTNQDVRQIAADMDSNIKTIKDSKALRHDAISICDKNSDFQPPER